MAGKGTTAVWGGETGWSPSRTATGAPTSLRGGLDAIRAFLPRLAIAHRAANLGCVETVVGPPVVTSHVECTAEERRAAGIPEGLVRYSTGIEDVEDLIADLEQALAGLR